MKPESQIQRFPEDGDIVPVARFERRTGKRHVTILRLARLSAGDTEALGIVRDISEGGMKLELKVALDGMESVAVSLFDDRWIDGRIVWRDGNVAGIQFSQAIDVETALVRQPRPRLGQQPRRPRIPVDSAALVGLDAKWLNARICDVSQNGAKLKIDRELPQGSEITLHLGALGRQKARVRWQHDGCIGVMFAKPLAMRDLVDWTTASKRK
jgi:PilZ domain